MTNRGRARRFTCIIEKIQEKPTKNETGAALLEEGYYKFMNFSEGFKCRATKKVFRVFSLPSTAFFPFFLQSFLVT